MPKLKREIDLDKPDCDVRGPTGERLVQSHTEQSETSRDHPSVKGGWYIAITNPNCHRRAEVGLAAIGYRVFWPKLRKWVSHARTKKAKDYPVLGRYVFVEITDDEFYRVRNVNGVEGLLTWDSGKPAKMPAEVVYGFRERYMSGEWDFVANETGEFINGDGEIVTRKNPIPTGAIVRIMEGEFADLMTVIRGKNSRGKLEFLPPGKREFFYTREQNVRAA